MSVVVCVRQVCGHWFGGMLYPGGRWVAMTARCADQVAAETAILQHVRRWYGQRWPEAPRLLEPLP